MAVYRCNDHTSQPLTHRPAANSRLLILVGAKLPIIAAHFAAADLVALQRPVAHYFSSAKSFAFSHAGGLISVLFVMLLHMNNTRANVCRYLFSIPATLRQLVDSPITLHHRTLTAATLYVYSRSVGYESLNLYTIDLPASVCVRTCHWDNM